MPSFSTSTKVQATPVLVVPLINITVHHTVLADNRAPAAKILKHYLAAAEGTLSHHKPLCMHKLKIHVGYLDQ